MSRWSSLLASGAAWAVVSVGAAATAVPLAVPYSGALEYVNGAPVDSIVHVEVKIFDADAGGNEVWSEDLGPVDVTDGRLNLLLGTTGSPSLDVVFATGDSRWLEFSIDIDGAGAIPPAILTPRQSIESVPYAIEAGNAARLGGVDASDFIAADAAGNVALPGGDVTTAGSIGVGTTDPKSALHVVGEVQIGDSGATCSADLEGALRYDSSTKTLLVCDGSDFVSVGTIGSGGGTSPGDGSTAANAATSCAAILAAGLADGNKSYFIDPNGPPHDDAVSTPCLMDDPVLGGGWTSLNASFLTTHATISTAVSEGGSASLISGNAVRIRQDAILEIDVKIPFTQYRMYLEGDSNQGTLNPDDTSGWTAAEFLSSSFGAAGVDYNKSTEVRNGIAIADFTVGNSCDNDGDQTIAWGTVQAPHSMKIGGEFGCNYQGGFGTGFVWDMLDFIESTPQTSVFRFKFNDDGNGEEFFGDNLQLWVR